MALSNCPIIAGSSAGKVLRCSDRLHPSYQKLEQAAARGNHWAGLAVKELNGLTSGRIGKNNIYVKPSHLRPRGLDQFFVFLPGIKATVERQANDQYLVVDMVLDALYFKATGPKSRAGLHRAEKRRTWQTDHVPDGKVLPNPDRIVAISDSGWGDADLAAQKVAANLAKAPGANPVALPRTGFDLHFTPGKRRLGSLLQYDAVGIESAHGSASLLADAMVEAKDVEGVQWIAEHGGSVVLTQALQILVDRGVRLRGHTAFMYRPVSSPGKAVRLAHQLEMTLAGDFAKTGYNPLGAASQVLAAGARLKNRHDQYDRGHHMQTWITGITQAASVIGLGAAAGGSLGASIPMVAAIAGALTIATGGISTVSNTLALGKSLTESAVHKLKAKR